VWYIKVPVPHPNPNPIRLDPLKCLCNGQMVGQMVGQIAVRWSNANGQMVRC